MSNPIFPLYDTEIFTNIYNDVNTFITDYTTCGIPTTISQTNATTLFYLLYGKFGNSPIANLDVTQFKYKLFSIIWQYGPTWEKRLKIQEDLRNDAINWSEGESTSSSTSASGSNSNTVTYGKKNITNHAYNPETAPGTGTNTELAYINEQQVSTDSGQDSNSGSNSQTIGTTTGKTLGLLDKYQWVWDLLANDVTAEFLSRFNICFKQFVRPAKPLLYESEE